VVPTTLRPTGTRCRGDPVGRPAGPWRRGHPGRSGAVVHDRTRATHRVAPTCTTGSTLTRRCAPASPCQGEASFLCRETARCKPSLRRTKPRRLLSLALDRARERMKGEGVGRTSIHDATHPHPARRAGGRQCRGDPVGRPSGPWRPGTRDDAGPSCTIAPGRRTASPLHAPQDQPSPGAARRRQAM
jgi:hypothetical protein